MKLLDCPVSNVIEVPVNFEGNFEELPEGTYFIVSPTYIYKLLKTPLLETLLPYDGDSNKLRKHIYGANENFEPKTAYLLKTSEEFKIEANDMARIMRFFREVYNKHQAESAVILLVNIQTKKFKPLYVVNYDVSGGRVCYINPVQTHNDDRINELLKNKDVYAEHEKSINEYNKLYNEGYRIFGTIHSHCDFGAFHSGVDDADEIKSDGLHITIGNCNSGWSYSQRWGISGFFWPVDDINTLVDRPIEEIEKLVDAVPFNSETDLQHVFPDGFGRPQQTNKSYPHWSTASFPWDDEDYDIRSFKNSGAGKQRYNIKTREWESENNSNLSYSEMYKDIANKAYGKATPLKKNSKAETSMQKIDLEEFCESFEDDIWPEEECVFILDTDTNNTYIMRMDFYMSNKNVIDEAVNLRLINNGYEHLEGTISDIPE